MLPVSDPIVYYVAQLYSNGLSDYKLGTISLITYPHLHPREKTTDIFRLCASNLVAGAASQHDIQPDPYLEGSFLYFHICVF